MGVDTGPSGGLSDSVMAPRPRAGSVGRVVDVILPVLDEAAALPGVLARIPPEATPSVVDNGSTDGSGALAWELRRRTGVPLRDLGPMRAGRREALLALGIEDRRFGWPLEMVLRAAAEEWRIEEREVSYVPRTGRSKVTGTVRGTARAVRDMAAVLT